MKKSPTTEHAPKQPLPARTPSANGRKPDVAGAAMQRRDAPGHLSPKYAADLHAISQQGDHGKTTDDSAFIHGMHTSEPFAERLGEDFVRAANSGEDEGGDINAEVFTEENGGPFVESSDRQEFARGTDGTNPPGATREPFPKT